MRSVRVALHLKTTTKLTPKPPVREVAHSNGLAIGVSRNCPRRFSLCCPSQSIIYKVVVLVVLMALLNRTDLKPLVLALRKKPVGRCAFCGRETVIEKHHVSYRPSKTINLCHNCHFKVHFFPNRLTEYEIRLLVCAKSSGSQINIIFNTKESLNKVCSDYKHSLTLRSLHDEKNQKHYREIAPSRKAELVGCAEREKQKV